MAQNTRGVKEFSREQRLINENRKLKRENARLSKLLARIDLDRYSTIKDMIDDHQAEDALQRTQELLNSLKEAWKCRDCDTGYLEIVLFTKMGNQHYFRACNSCKNRTKSQVYDPTKVKGIVKK